MQNCFEFLGIVQLKSLYLFEFWAKEFGILNNLQNKLQNGDEN